MYQVFYENDVVTNKSGEKFVIQQIINNGKHTRYIIKGLDSGYVTDISRMALYSGRFCDNLISHNRLGTIIGYAKPKQHKRVYSVWVGMCLRCLDPKHTKYKFYGAKGITICKRWMRFDYFLEDIPKLKGYDEEKFLKGEIQIDKDIANKNLYSPETCEFVPALINRQMALEKRQRPFIIYDKMGLEKEYKCVKECANDYGLDDSCITKCLKGKRSQHKGYYFKYI